MRHMTLTCKHHTDLRWSCKESAYSPGYGYNGMRNLFFFGVREDPLAVGHGYCPTTRSRDDGTWITECFCSTRDLIPAPEDLRETADPIAREVMGLITMVQLRAWPRTRSLKHIGQTLEYGADLLDMDSKLPFLATKARHLGLHLYWYYRGLITWQELGLVLDGKIPLGQDVNHWLQSKAS